MTRYIKMLSSLVVTVAVIANGVEAGSIRIVEVPNPGGMDPAGTNTAGTETHDIYVDAGLTEQIVAIQLYVELLAGSFFNHPFGSNTPPNAAFFPFFTNLPFDTFVASGQPVNAVFNPTIASASVDLGSPNSGGAQVFDGNTVDVTFRPQAGQPTMGAQSFLVARLTMLEPTGYLRMDVEFSGGGPHARINFPIPNFPEPTRLFLASVALCGVAGATARRR